MNFKEQLNEQIEYAEHMVIRNGVVKEEGYQKTVLSAMNYSVLAGGKRLRPLFMNEMYKMFGEEHPCIGDFMAAIELIHTYSLVHDDLPAMDNDEYRRGKKTTHIVYGEDMAILTGDALLNYAFEIASSSLSKCMDNPKLLERGVKALQILSKKAGIYGMVGGQVYDVEAENKQLSLDEDSLLFIFKLKTSALIISAMTIGAVLGGASEAEVMIVEDIGEAIGIAFQIRDDILDVTGTQEVLGKPIGSDEKNNKTTYVTLKGIDAAKEDVVSYSNKAIELLDTLGCDADFLKKLFDYLITREK